MPENLLVGCVIIWVVNWWVNCILKCCNYARINSNKFMIGDISLLEIKIYCNKIGVTLCLVWNVVKSDENKKKLI